MLVSLIAVLAVIALLTLFVVLAIEKLAVNVGLRVRRDAMKALNEYDEVLDRRSQEISSLLSDQTPVFPEVKKTVTVEVPERAESPETAAYRDPEFLSLYQQLKKATRWTRKRLCARHWPISPGKTNQPGWPGRFWSA